MQIQAWLARFGVRFWDYYNSHPVVAAIVVGLIPSLIASFIASVVGFIVGGWEATFGWIRSLWELLVYPIPVPSGILCILILMLLWQLTYWAVTWLKKPPWIRYTTDIIYDVRWRWSYRGKNIQDLRSYCTKDDTRLRLAPQEPNELGITYLLCDKCAKLYGPFHGRISDQRRKVVCQIDQKQRNGKWREVVAELSE